MLNISASKYAPIDINYISALFFINILFMCSFIFICRYLDTQLILQKGFIIDSFLEKVSTNLGLSKLCLRHVLIMCTRLLFAFSLTLVIFMLPVILNICKEHSLNICKSFQTESLSCSSWLWKRPQHRSLSWFNVLRNLIDILLVDITLVC